MSNKPDSGSVPNLGADRDLWDGQPRQRAMKLIQGYVWHPRDLQIQLFEYRPRQLPGGSHLLLDAMPAAPFAFFEDGTLSATQQVYQATVVRIVQPSENPAAGLTELAELLQQQLNTTPEGVGWQLMEDLREVD